MPPKVIFIRTQTHPPSQIQPNNIPFLRTRPKINTVPPTPRVGPPPSFHPGRPKVNDLVAGVSQVVPGTPGWLAPPTPQPKPKARVTLNDLAAGVTQVVPGSAGWLAPRPKRKAKAKARAQLPPPMPRSPSPPFRTGPCATHPASR